MARKQYMPALKEDEIPTFPALGRSVVEGQADPNKAVVKSKS